MDRCAVPVSSPVLIIGYAAANALKEPADGQVEAVFESTFYIRTGTRLVCLGRVDMEAGPINCATSAPETVNWRQTGLKPHTRVRVSLDMIEIGGTLRFPLSGSSRWSPELGDQSILPTEVARGAKAFRRAAAGRDDIDGLGRFLVPGYRPEQHNHVCRAAELPMAHAFQWLVQAFQVRDGNPGREMKWVRKLAGLGPGLTPSGDDFLGGVMIALRALGEEQLCRDLWHPLKRCALEDGNAISLAHLSVAADGAGSVGIHRAVRAIACGDTDAVCTALDGVAAIGHSSGWDIMTGVIITFEAWLTAQMEIGRV